MRNLLFPWCKYHYGRVARWRWLHVQDEYPRGVRVCPVCVHASYIFATKKAS